MTVDLTFKREFSYYLLTIYIPCCMLVIVSWVSFWLDPNAVPARVSLGVTTLLTMSTQTASINNSLPPVAYTKAIDVWTGVRNSGIFFKRSVSRSISSAFLYTAFFVQKCSAFQLLFHQQTYA